MLEEPDIELVKWATEEAARWAGRPAGSDGPS
jgi:hypothetical protein